MKYRLSIGLLVTLVSMIMLMSNALANLGPGVFWMNQATLSNVDSRPSQDPENSGFWTTQVTVWEEWNGADWDIWMKYSLADGAPGTWVFPVLHPATTPLNEINPAVTVTNMFQGAPEIHVVYQRVNPAFPLTWDICHTFTNNFGVAWSLPVILDNIPANDAIDPAIVYTDDLAPGPGGGATGMLVQFVWAEFNPGTAAYEIYYDAYYFDPTIAPPRNYLSATIGTTLVRASPVGSCEVPEIASIDETTNGAAYDYYFAVVWQEPTAPGPFNLNIWYIAGTTSTSGAAMGVVFTLGSLGPLSAVPAWEDCYDPDIAATQDYQNPEDYYFHVDWVHRIQGTNPTYQIDKCYYYGAVPTPAAAVFLPTPPARGPTLIVLDRPTIASKLIAVIPQTLFETWMCWEDSSAPVSAPDIWYRMGQCNAAGVFLFMVPSAVVPYVQPFGSSEYNPELWNRNDALRMFPLFTHLVFDMTTGFAGNQEVEYIDP